MACPARAAERSEVVLEIGGSAIGFRSEDLAFVDMLRERYAGFVSVDCPPSFRFEIDMLDKGVIPQDRDVSVRWDSGRWNLERGDFHAEWDPRSASGRIRQSANPFALDSVLRIVHTLLLARKGGFLVHAASAVRNGRAFLFAGVSGAGKTTMARLAPPDATLLTDEISYVTRQTDHYQAYGTPFVGELGRRGANVRAPIDTLYLLKKGPENQLETVSGAEAARSLLENVLFFAQDPELVKLVFQAACDFVCRVPVQRLTFAPDARVWEMVA